MSAFKCEMTETGIAVVTFDLPGEKINKISAVVGEEFERLIQELDKNPDVKGMVLISAKPDIFIAGADINEILAINSEEDGRQKSTDAQRLPNQLEDLSFPTVAAMDGVCLGGGFELVLGFTYRIATPNPKTMIGLPEVSLGILPGMGGCNRLPRLAGLQQSLAMILAAARWPAKKCLKAGIVDEVVPKELLLSRAIEVIEKGLWQKKKKKKVSLVNTLLERTRFGRNLIRKKAKENILKKTRGHYPAPLKALEVIYDSLDRGLSDGLKVEAEGFGILANSEVSKHLIQLFFASEAAKKKTGVENSAIQPEKIHSAGVLGAGTMGGGIAQLLSYRDIHVRLKDINEGAIAKGLATSRALYDKMVKRKRMTRYDLNHKMSLIGPSTEYYGFKNLDVVIEAVVEDVGIKQKVFADLETRVSPETILASNTSSLSIADIAAKCEKKDRVIGMHFFNPVHKMPLVEIIVDPITSERTVATTVALAKRLGKMPIVIKNAPGFLVNRVLMPYMNEAAFLLEEGIPVELIDKAMLAFGMPMGPFTLIDAVGIDVAQKVSVILHNAFGDRMTPSSVLEKVVAAGFLGQKNKKGFFLSGKKRSKVNTAIYDAIGVRPKHQDYVSDEWRNRMVYQMVNEAIRCLEEGIVRDANDCDLALIFGIGFPPFRGGLLKYVDTLGPDKVLNELGILERRYGARFQPPQYLKDMVESGRTFYGH